MTGPSISVLVLDDNPDDIRRLRSVLEADHLHSFVLTSAATLDLGLELLRYRRFDSVILDLHLADSQGLSAIAQISRVAVDIPVLVWSDDDDEAEAIHALRSGAQEYLAKERDGFTRVARAICYAIERQRFSQSLQEPAGQADQACIGQCTAEAQLRQSEESYRYLFENNPHPMWTYDLQTLRFLTVNDSAVAKYGYSREEFLNMTIADIRPPEDLERLRENLTPTRPSLQHSGEWRHRLSDGTIIDVEISSHTIKLSGHAAALVVAQDITARKQIEQKLLELNQTLEERVTQRTTEVQDLYEHAPAGYHSLDVNGRLVMINQTELDWLGYTREELLGRPYDHVIATSSHQTFREQFQDFKQCGMKRDLELELIRKDGTIFPILLSAIAVYDDAGNYIMSRSTVSDITERKRAENALRESEAQNRLLFEEAPDAVVLFDGAGRMLRMNRAFERMTGYPSAQLTGHTFDELSLTSIEQAERLAALVVESLQSKNFASTTFKLRRADRELCDVGVRVFGISIQGVQHYLTTMRDITVEKQTEDALRLANAELARAARAKDEFLATMSHELRTPLNAILAFSESLAETIYGPLNARQLSALQHIEDSGHHLLALINDILDISKVEAGRLDLQLEPVSIAEVCQSSLQFVREIALKKSLQLTLQLNDPLVSVEADPKRLKQILVNLLSNAVKFTQDGGKVHLEVTVDAAAGVVHFAVVDTGIGIAAEDQARLFQPFSQLDSSLSRPHEGTGLGLALVRRLTELHGGSIAVESAPGQGSRFMIALPYHPEEAREKQPIEAGRAPHRLKTSTIKTIIPEPEQAGARILLAEDNETTIEVMDAYLQARGYQVTIARTGYEALDRAGEVCPEMILMDIQMTDLDGLEAIHRLRARSGSTNTPIIALTALAMTGDRERCLAAGANEYLTKPVSLNGLVETIERLLHESSNGRPQGEP